MKARLAGWLLILAGVVPLLAGLGNELQEPDPAQYAEVARRMLVSGDFVHLSDNFGAFLNKPPLTMWLIAASVWLLGASSVAVRLPSLLAGLVTLFAVSRIGRSLWDEHTGRTASGLLAGSLAFQLMIADPKVDMMLTAMISLAVWLALEARRRPWAMWLAWGAGALGVLSKGPLGLCAPIAAVLPEAVRRRWGSSGGEAAGGFFSRLAVLRPLSGPLLAAAVAAPWYWAVYEEHGIGGPRFLLWEQSFGRITQQGEYRDSSTPLFFVHTALWAFLPFAPVLAYQIGRRAWALARSRALPHDESRVVWWWMLVPLSALSLSSYKLPQYLFWLAPPAALIAARGIAEAPARARVVLEWILLAAGLLGTLACVGVMLWIFPAGSALATAGWSAALAALFLGGALVAWKLDAPIRTAALCALAVLPLNAFFELHLHPSLTRHQPGREIGEVVRREDPHGKVLPFAITAGMNSAAFYAERPVVEVGPEDLSRIAARGEARVAVTQADHLESLAAAGVEVTPLLELPLYGTSRPGREFLDPRTREAVSAKLVVVRLASSPAGRR
ncbi:MAG: glycosyltransferase family 39 protein [Myxococcales bacterium]|nr:glycosyltransferase family 39 protein [Myxococcales bacterium]